MSNDEITVFRNGDSIISFIACFGGFSSLQAASNNKNRSAAALVIMGPSKCGRADSRVEIYPLDGKWKCEVTHDSRESHQQHRELTQTPQLAGGESISTGWMSSA